MCYLPTFPLFGNMVNVQALVTDTIVTGNPCVDEKVQMSEKDSGKGVSEKDVQVVGVDEDEDMIRESGMLLSHKQYEKSRLSES